MNRIKLGDTFSVSLHFYDEVEKLPIVLDESMLITAVIKDTYSNILSTVHVNLYDQIEYAGWVSLTVSSKDTITWKPGRGVLDIKIELDVDNIVSTQSYEFLIDSASVQGRN